MSRLILENLHVQASVGILEHERRSTQPLLLTVAVELPHAGLPAQDEVHCVFDYRHLRDVALEEVQRGHVNLLETLAGRIVERLLRFPPVGRVVVRVDKPNIFPDCRSVGVEIEGSRASATATATATS